MKKVITLLVLILATSYAGYSQENQNLNNLISGKWFIQTMEVENDLMNLSEENHWMVFHENGFYQLMLDNEEQVGTWHLNEQNELKLDNNTFQGSSVIKKLDDKEFKFSVLGSDIQYTIALKK